MYNVNALKGFEVLKWPKFTIQQIIPVSNYWNVYINEETQEERIMPVSCLALIQEEGRQKLKYLDLLHIVGHEEGPEAFEELTFMHTLYKGHIIHNEEV